MIVLRSLGFLLVYRQGLFPLLAARAATYERDLSRFALRDAMGPRARLYLFTNLPGGRVWLLASKGGPILGCQLLLRRVSRNNHKE